jgi:5-methylcytosine-specific restriction endonuclease McrA
MESLSFSKKICCDCGKEFASNITRAIRCKECRPAAEKRQSRQDTKRWQKKNKDRLCSRCKSPVKKRGICGKCSAYVLRWKASNKDKVAAIRRKRLACWRDRKGRLLTKLIKKQDYRCTVCGLGFGPWHLDHIIPKAKGGLDEEINFQALCGPCNLRKGTKVVVDYLLG